MPLRHQLLNALGGEVNDQAPGRRQQIAHLCGYDVLNGGSRERLFEHVREVFQDDDRRGARVSELLLQFAGSVQGIDVHYNHSRAEDTEERDGVLQQIGHHQGNARSLGQTEALQPGGELTAEAVEIGICNSGAKIAEGGEITKFAAALGEDVVQGRVFADVDLRWYTRAVTLQPDLVHR